MSTGDRVQVGPAARHAADPHPAAGGPGRHRGFRQADGDVAAHGPGRQIARRVPHQDPPRGRLNGGLGGHVDLDATGHRGDLGATAHGVHVDPAACRGDLGCAVLALAGNVR